MRLNPIKYTEWHQFKCKERILYTYTDIIILVLTQWQNKALASEDKTYMQ